MLKWAVIEILVVWVLTWGLLPHVLAQRTRSPTATLAWVWAIFLLPAIGGIFYLLFGTERIARKRLRLVKAIRQAVAPNRSGETPAPQALGQLDLEFMLPELRKINGCAPTSGNSVVLLPDGVSFFPKLITIIREATQHLHLQFYIWNKDAAGRQILAELVAAAKRGVEVRLLLDEIGSLMVTRRFFRPLTDAGGKFSWFKTFAPLRGSFHLNLRNHRKLVVADGVVALTGGMNVGDEYWSGAGKQLPYRDLQLEVRGPAVIQLAQHFAQDWFFATQERITRQDYYPPAKTAGNVSVQVVAGGPDNEVNEIQLSVLSLLHRSQHRVWMMTPYFVPEAPLLTALQIAAMRGVDVRIMVPRKSDHGYLSAVTRSYYEELLPHGVKIYEYLPRLLHAKSTTIDGIYGMAGSANLDVRSLTINFELNLLFACPVLTEQLDKLFEQNLREAERVERRVFLQRPFRQKIAEAVCRPLAPLL